ncbi:MAG TPA: cyclic nucleotide-binding domain-containing protein [Steroidobacteraceae bacterium]|nr:cyclic nucleotide-binding domain-containing protein [Steroidobacteraceae bacterium]
MDDKPLDLELLKAFSPLDGLKKENLHALAKKTSLREMDSGRILFKEGDNDKRTYFLVAGSVEIFDNDGVLQTVRGGTPAARNALAPTLPRRFGARAVDNIRYIVVDSDLLDVMLTWDQTGSYEVEELHGSEAGGSDDWMTTLLQTKAFHRIPPANIQAIFMRMQRLNYRAGDVVIKQGDEGDYFYVIVSGRCSVTRETPLNKEGIKLAELGMGDTFGEEALISEAKRNATVTMLVEGTLMRLGKQDFNTLLNEPMLQWVDYEQAKQIVAKGGKWLDVRLPSEFQNLHIDDAINIPLYFIRLKLNALDKGTSYVVCCDTGRRSSAGAYILSERGFDAHVLKGGLAATDVVKRK